MDERPSYLPGQGGPEGSGPGRGIRGNGCEAEHCWPHPALGCHRGEEAPPHGRLSGALRLLPAPARPSPPSRWAGPHLQMARRHSHRSPPRSRHTRRLPLLQRTSASGLGGGGVAESGSNRVWDQRSFRESDRNVDPLIHPASESKS